jgi:hypothetical protein
MRLPPDSQQAGPASVNRYLLPDERQVIAVRRHPGILIPPAATAMGGLLAAVAMGTIIHGNQYLPPIIWGLVIFLWIQLIWAFLSWLTGYFAITNKRLLLISGVLSRRVTVTPLAGIHDLIFERPFAGRIFGYGTFIIEPAGQGLSVIEFLPYPEQLYLELYSLLSGGSLGDGEPRMDQGDD